jgi:hypothetical protein
MPWTVNLCRWQTRELRLSPSLVVKGLALERPTHATPPLQDRLLRSRSGSALIADPREQGRLVAENSASSGVDDNRELRGRGWAGSRSVPTVAVSRSCAPATT